MLHLPSYMPNMFIMNCINSTSHCKGKAMSCRQLHCSSMEQATSSKRVCAETCTHLTSAINTITLKSCVLEKLLCMVCAGRRLSWRSRCCNRQWSCDRQRLGGASQQNPVMPLSRYCSTPHSKSCNKMLSQERVCGVWPRESVCGNRQHTGRSDTVDCGAC